MNTIRSFILAASVLLAMAITISCSSDDDGGGSGGDISNGPNDAWMFCYDEDEEEGGCVGLAFRDGKFYEVRLTSIANSWYQEEIGTYSTSGGKITTNVPGEGKGTVNYSVSGNTLTIDFGDEDVEVYTKRTGLTFVSMDDLLRDICESSVEMGYFTTVEECIEEMEEAEDEI